MSNSINMLLCTLSEVVKGNVLASALVESLDTLLAASWKEQRRWRDLDREKREAAVVELVGELEKLQGRRPTCCEAPEITYWTSDISTLSMINSSLDALAKIADGIDEDAMGCVMSLGIFVDLIWKECTDLRKKVGQLQKQIEGLMIEQERMTCSSCLFTKSQSPIRRGC